MADPFVAEIRMFGFNFAPTGWRSVMDKYSHLAEHGPFLAARNLYGGNGQAPSSAGHGGQRPDPSGSGPGTQPIDLGQVGRRHHLAGIRDTASPAFLAGNNLPATPNPGYSSLMLAPLSPGPINLVRIRPSRCPFRRSCRGRRSRITI